MVTYDVMRVRRSLDGIWDAVEASLALPRGEKARERAYARYLRRAWHALDSGEVERAMEYWWPEEREAALLDDECLALLAAGLAIEDCGFGWSEPFVLEARECAEALARLRASESEDDDE